MDNPDSTLGAEQKELATAGKPVAPTSWSVLAFGIHFKETPIVPWRQYKEFLEKPLMAGIFGFALQYFCNDMSNVVQKQSYGIITFSPYIIMFSILFLLSVLWWIIHVRHVKACQSLETLPLHRQDIQVDQTQQQLTQIINENTHAEDVQVDPGVDQTQQGFFIRTEEFCTLMDCWFSTRLGDMTRDEAMDRMKHIVEMGNRRSRGISVVNTADQGQAVMSETLETRGVERRHLPAGSSGYPSGYETQIGSTSPVLRPRTMERNNRAQVRSLSHDGLVLKIPQNVDVGELVEIFDANLPGCRELHRRIEIGTDYAGCSRESLISQMLKSLRMAWTLDKDSTIQLGSFAVFKYTDAGIQCWLLQEDWTPTILDVRRSSQNFMDFFTGEKTNWTIRGFNLQSSTLRVATAEQTDNLTNVHHYKTENGVDVVLFKLPRSLPMFLDGVYVSASKTVEVQEGVSLKLHSQARKLQRAFWISVVDSIIPRPWTVIMMASLLLLAHSFVARNFAIVLPLIVTACVYLSQDYGLRQGGDHNNGEPVTSPAEDSSNALESSRTTHREDKLTNTDLLTEEQDGDPLPEIQGLQIVGRAVLGGTLTACGHSINGTTLCMFQWVRQDRNGTAVCIQGAVQPEYTITADDNGTIISVECVPMDERNRRGKLVTASVNVGRWITCENQTTGDQSKNKKALGGSIPFLTLQQVSDATKMFTRKIGETSIGPVYYGKLPNGQEIAVKMKSSESRQSSEAFLNEVELLSRIHHRNLVSLVGYCEEGSQQILVYHFVSNGTLRDYLYGDKSRKSLDWKTRVDIALNAARGLEYLHTGCNPTIIHCDVKSCNILIDENMVAKVSDFGISKQAPEGIFVDTLLEGTPAYFDPEYFITKRLTPKTDVYSFGVVLLELISGRHPYVADLPDGTNGTLIQWVRSVVNSQRVLDIVDPFLKGGFNTKSLGRVILLALWCIEPVTANRPDMKQVVRVLEVETEELLKSDQDTNMPLPGGTHVKEGESEFLIGSGEDPVKHLTHSSFI